ncbi:hypothetical protein NDU88_003680 [Pleurodeles waltl]|uniref:Uncharacterized protein n=1 Tax=Pleurodeles waltl TaxID=8319 RepID=A0AAV7PCS2_PLEWA|nr:hypothetical protein NDU88_003680 [Pleurodeles waltl]
MVMERMNIGNLSRAELQSLCKERGLNAGRKTSKVDLQLALRAYEEAKRLEAVIEEDDPEEHLSLNEDEDPKGIPEL